ncbi:MAG: alkaline phosphatase family protein [Chloroflexi bacterium]|nr:alkaline phosphatase family protein [Chloroflexota bacterium]
MVANRPILVIFLDGVGIGEADPDKNPFLRAELPTLRGLFDGRVPTLGDGRLQGERALAIPVDASLGVAGVPQSATGQATLITGVNAARHLGYHDGPYPSPQLRQFIARESLIQKYVRAGARVYFANAYPEIYFARMARGTARQGALAWAFRSADIPLHNVEDLRAGRALTAHITNEVWRQYLGYRDLPRLTPRDAGRRLGRIGLENDFTLYEYYHTDVVGHKAHRERTLAALAEVDTFLGGVLEAFDLERGLLLVASDHGNVEDWTVKGHTLNPALLLVIGHDRENFAGGVQRLDDIAPAILRWMGIASQ